MERNPRVFSTAPEETIRDHYLVQLNGQYEGSATGETFNGHGHTDILVRDGNVPTYSLLQDLARPEAVYRSHRPVIGICDLALLIQLASIRLWLRVYEFTALVQIGCRASRLARSWPLTGHFAVTA